MTLIKWLKSHKALVAERELDLKNLRTSGFNSILPAVSGWEPVVLKHQIKKPNSIYRELPLAFL